MTHPHDLALLYDLLDERIAPSAAEELRKRLTEEPDLAAAWDELQRMREGLRALPSPAVPKGFLEGVKARAGIASAPGGSRLPAPPPAADGAAAPAGKVFRMRPWAFATAAGVGLVAGLVGYLVASRPDAATNADGVPPAKETAKTQADAYRKAADVLKRDEAAGGKEAERNAASRDDDAGATDARAPAAAGPATTAGRMRAPAPGGAPSGPPPTARFGAPGGAIQPGLRQPSDAPAPVLPVAPSRGAGSPPPAPPSEPPARESHDADGGVQPEGTLAYVREGVDDVLVLRADSLDEARAQVSIFYASLAQPASGAEWKAPSPAPDLRRYAGLAVLRLADDSEARKKEAGANVPPPPPTTPPPAGTGAPLAGARRGDVPAAVPGPVGGEAGAVPPESQRVLGSFLLDLSGEQWARANARISAEEARATAGSLDAASKTAPAPVPAGPPGEGYLAKGGAEKDKQAPAPKPAAAPTSSPAATPPPPAEGAMGEPGADDKSLRRRVRILVLPR